MPMLSTMKTFLRPKEARLTFCLGILKGYIFVPSAYLMSLFIVGTSLAVTQRPVIGGELNGIFTLSCCWSAALLSV